MSKVEDTPNLEEKEIDDNKELYVDHYTGEVIDTDEWVPYGITEFSEYDEAVEERRKATQARKDVKTFQSLIDNIFNNPDIADKSVAVVNLAKEFSARISSNVKELFVKPKEVVTPFQVFYNKETNQYRFIASYSNNARDQDNPPEIIASESHENFVKEVDAGSIELPDLWLWHIPDWRMGKTEVVAYDKENGVSIATGHFFPEANEIAKHIADNPEFWGVSHGMDPASVVRSKEDETVIIRHVTKEISPLPKFAAANKWADFNILKETAMSLSEEKKKQLAEAQVPTEILESLEQNNAELNKQLGELGVDRKEVAPVAEEPVVETEEITEEVPATEETPAEVAPPVEEVVPVTTEVVVEATPKEKAEPVFTEAQTKELVTTFDLFAKQLTDTVISQVKEVMEPVLKELEESGKTREELIKKQIEQTPPMSLSELVLNGSQLMEQSAAKSNDTKVDGRTVKGQKPAEVTPDNSIIQTGNPILDGVVSGVVNMEKVAA